MFGIVGVLSGIYWSLLNASVGLIGIWFGKDTLNRVNEMIGFINVWLPYIVLIICVSAGVFWLGSWIYELIMRCRDRKQLQDIPRADKIDNIKKMLDDLK